MLTHPRYIFLKKNSRIFAAISRNLLRHQRPDRLIWNLSQLELKQTKVEMKPCFTLSRFIPTNFLEEMKKKHKLWGWTIVLIAFSLFQALSDISHKLPPPFPSSNTYYIILAWKDPTQLNLTLKHSFLREFLLRFLPDFRLPYNLKLKTILWSLVLNFSLTLSS